MMMVVGMSIWITFFFTSAFPRFVSCLFDENNRQRRNSREEKRERSENWKASKNCHLFSLFFSFSSSERWGTTDRRRWWARSCRAGANCTFFSLFLRGDLKPILVIWSNRLSLFKKLSSRLTLVHSVRAHNYFSSSPSRALFKLFFFYILFFIIASLTFTCARSRQQSAQTDSQPQLKWR